MEFLLLDRPIIVKSLKIEPINRKNSREIPPMEALVEISGRNSREPGYKLAR